MVNYWQKKSRRLPPKRHFAGCMVKREHFDSYMVLSNQTLVYICNFFLSTTSSVMNKHRANIHRHTLCHRFTVVVDRTATIRPWDDAIKSDTIDDTMGVQCDNKPVRSSWITTNFLHDLSRLYTNNDWYHESQITRVWIEYIYKYVYTKE